MPSGANKSKVAPKKGPVARPGSQAKYDAHNTVLDRTYGALADLRRELADSKAAVAERLDLLRAFAVCTDSQRTWLLLEDYFSKLSLARKDFTAQDWWPRLLNALGQTRIEELAMLFLRSHRPLPSELAPSANLDRLARIDQMEQEQRLAVKLEHWMFPPEPLHLDQPRALLRVVASVRPVADQPGLNALHIEFKLSRPRTGERNRTRAEMIELTSRSTHEQELFSPRDWEFVQWLADTQSPDHGADDSIALTGSDLLQWLARWGGWGRLELASSAAPLAFAGQTAELAPYLENHHDHSLFTHRLALATGETCRLDEASFFCGRPLLVLVHSVFYIVRNAPEPDLLTSWLPKPSIPAHKLSHRFLGRLRQLQCPAEADWNSICIAHAARPRFVFELNDDTVRLRLLAMSERDQSLWQWLGHEWQPKNQPLTQEGKPEFLDDPRLPLATAWLRKLDWFTPEPGVWVSDANDNFLNSLAAAWPNRPLETDYLGNPGFHRLFLAPRKLRPQLVLHGSGIDWFTVSAAWEREGLRLTPADLARLATATGRFVKLPDTGWVELDAEAVQTAHEAFADLGLEGLSAVPQRINLLHASQLPEQSLRQFGDTAEARELRQHIAGFTGIPAVEMPAGVTAELRAYQKTGFEFLCHLSRLKLGGVLADDMGLGKTVQTLTWLVWLKHQAAQAAKPVLVICPASVLHNWQREASRFTPAMKVLVLESGAARHNLRHQIPQHDIIITNYALLRRDLAALQKFEFQAVILDEAQFIKNPGAQVTQSVKQLRTMHRLALTGTPLENRLLDLWSILDFVQPGYLGTQTQFEQTFELPGADLAAQTIARRRLSSKLRPLLLRRLKRQVAQDLPDRIEERRDCELGAEQRRLYLAELRRSREQILQTVADQGLAKSKIHILAALTRLRQICCHPQLVGNESSSGKSDTLFELLEPLLAEGQKVLVFSQFVQMLRLLQVECQQRQIPTCFLSGDTKNRSEVVQAFQTDPNATVFLLSLRAAGTGLNLTAASYVVLYDPWWNPAVEAQAIDRTHRIGQTRTVNAYRLIAPGTVEEKIWELQQRKAQTITDVLGEQGFARSLSRTDLEYLFADELKQ